MVIAWKPRTRMFWKPPYCQVGMTPLEGRERLDAHPFYWVALSDLAIRAGDMAAARTWLSRGLTAARTVGERDMFLRRLGDGGGAVS